MITLETLPGDKGTKQKRRRVGRGHGSGHGKTSGRGHKGYLSRSGAKRRSGFEGGQMPIQRRLPKRGFKNPFRKEYQVVNLSSIEKRFDENATIGALEMFQMRLITDLSSPVKILGDGDVSKKLTIQANAFSAGARKKVEERGGVCEVV